MEQVKNLNNKLEKVKAFVDYSNKYPAYYNALEQLNIGENSISQLLAWLLDTNWVNDNDPEENQLHRIFTYEFLKLIKNQEKETDKSILQEYNDEKLKELAYGIVAKQGKDNIDILLVNKTMKFVCVIENKKRAKLSTSKIHDERGILRIEKYCNYIDENYEEYNKKFVYLCAEKDDLCKTIADCIDNIDNSFIHFKNSLTFKSRKYTDFKDNKVSWILSELNYTVLEHSQVVLILYNILRRIYNKAFDENGILKPVSKLEILEITTTLPEILMTDTLKISANTQISFYDYITEKLDYEQQIKLLCQYVEYWELHNGTEDFSDNLLGYSKIVDGEYIYNICKNLKDNKNGWINLLILAKNSEKLQKIISNV